MTRDELIRELRSRFIERRAAFPELCEMVRYLSGDSSTEPTSPSSAWIASPWRSLTLCSIARIRASAAPA